MAPVGGYRMPARFRAGGRPERVPEARGFAEVAARVRVDWALPALRAGADFLDLVAGVGSSRLGRNTTSILPMIWTGEAVNASQIAASNASRSLLPSTAAWTLINSWASSERSISRRTDSEAPWPEIRTTGLSACALARSSRRDFPGMGTPGFLVSVIARFYRHP